MTQKQSKRQPGSDCLFGDKLYNIMNIKLNSYKTYLFCRFSIAHRNGKVNGKQKLFYFLVKNSFSALYRFVLRSFFTIISTVRGSPTRISVFFALVTAV